MGDTLETAQEAHRKAKNATVAAKQKVREAEDHLKKMQALEHLSFMALCDAIREQPVDRTDLDAVLKRLPKI